MAGVTPPARWAPAKKIPWMVPRSARGIQREKVRATLGQAPASPAPNRKRIDDQRGQVEGRPGGHGEGRPPDDDAREHPAGAEAVRPPGGGDLEGRVGQGEGAVDVAHLLLAQRQVPHDVRGEGPQAGPVEVGHHRQQDGQADHLVTRAAGGRGRIERRRMAHAAVSLSARSAREASAASVDRPVERGRQGLAGGVHRGGLGGADLGQGAPPGLDALHRARARPPRPRRGISRCDAARAARARAGSRPARPRRASPG